MSFDKQAYEKSFTSLRHWLLGMKFYKAAEALQFARELHTGTRKDNVTPEDDHQLQVTQYVRTLHSGLIYPEDTLTASLLHDVVEDKPVDLSTIERMFEDRVALAVLNLSKKTVRGPKRSMEEYYGTMANDPIASIVKGSDRIHNSQTMIGVFTRAKQIEYMEETKGFILPMLKAARRNHPPQHHAYMNAKLVLVSQLQLIEAIHNANRTR